MARNSFPRRHNLGKKPNLSQIKTNHLVPHKNKEIQLSRSSLPIYLSLYGKQLWAVSVSPQHLLFHFIFSFLRCQPEHQLFIDMREVFWVWTCVFNTSWCNSVAAFGKMQSIYVRVIIHFVDLWYLRRLLTTTVNAGDYLITPHSFNTKAFKRVVGEILVCWC